MENAGAVSQNQAITEARATRLARLARWSVGFGVAGIVLALLYKRGGIYPFGGQYNALPLVLSVVSGLAGIALGYLGSRPTNTVNRTVGYLGLALGILSLLVMIFLPTKAWILYQPSPRPPAP